MLSTTTPFALSNETPYTSGLSAPLKVSFTDDGEPRLKSAMRSALEASYSFVSGTPPSTLSSNASERLLCPKNTRHLLYCCERPYARFTLRKRMLPSLTTESMMSESATGGV